MQSLITTVASFTEEERARLEQKLGAKPPQAGRWWCCCQNMFDSERINTGRWLLLFLPGEQVSVGESDAPTSRPTATTEQYNEKSLDREQYLENRARERQRFWLKQDAARSTSLALEHLASAEVLSLLHESETAVLLFTSETPEQQRHSARYTRFLCENVRTLSDWENVWNEEFDLPLFRWRSTILYKPCACLFVEGQLVQFDADVLVEPAKAIRELLKERPDT